LGGKKAGEIEEFLKKVKERFEPKLILLFGSRARGEELKESDYDLIVVSEKFRGVPFLERLYMLYELWDLKQRADILAYTPDEFEQKKNEIGVVRKAVEEGIVIGGRSEEKLGRGFTLGKSERPEQVKEAGR
jgi:predicted nucleotidyltransferase